MISPTPTAIPRVSTPHALPFSAVPHALRLSMKGKPQAIVLAATLLAYARTKPYCYPSNATLAADMGCSVSTIRNAMTTLRDAGWVRLELGSNQPNGRRIWLTWRCTPVPSQAPRLSQVSDTPQPAGPPAQPVEPPTQRAEPPTQLVEPPTQPVEPESRIVVVEAKKESSEEATVTDFTLRSRPDQSSQASTITVPASASPSPISFDLRAIGQPQVIPVPTTAPRPPRPQYPGARRPRLGLTLEELAGVAGDDPILAAELARRTAPPAPAAPPPAIIPTLELFESLPGRHDLIMAAARRLCEETGDFKNASQRTFEMMATAVATHNPGGGPG